MHIAILHNADHDLLDNDPGREAREDVARVASALANALDGEELTTELVPAHADSLDFVEHLRRAEPDLVVNLCESLAADSRGEIAIPCLLEMLRLPYTGASALSLALCLHKNKAKEILRARGVPTPLFAVIEHLDELAELDIPFPVIVKPVHEDASVGVELDSVVHDRLSLARVVERVLRTHAQPALVESFIAGREVYVPLLGNAPRRALPLTEIQFGAWFDDRPNIISYRGKWEPGCPEFDQSPSGPATLDSLTEARCVRTAMAAAEALELRDYGRVDLRVTPAGEPFVIDVNPNCDLHPEAGFAKSARLAGFTYEALARRVVDIALERTRHGHATAHPPHRHAGSAAARGAAEPHLRVHAGGGRVRA